MKKNDQYYRGYQDGQNDASADPPKPRDFRKMGVSWKYWGSMFLEIVTLFTYRADDMLDSYIQGYKDGYNQSIQAKYNPQKVEVINSENTNKSNTMSTVQSLELQLRQLESLKHFLDAFGKEMESKMREYNSRVEQLHRDGLTIESYKSFQEYHLKPTNHKIADIKTFLERESIPYVSKNIEATKSSLSIARSR
ncbi:hypothetical protein [Maribellus maritimus]|uniref:hypothetical protein n=1 Tax=Maribellus maritimus TaxID=2870838 RepID=UPI001EE9FD07|nr:hypothetical protein [Maribellus maritimus]MCG6191406.1 hypothetical protein [Maribellus maritimus]